MLRAMTIPGFVSAAARFALLALLGLPARAVAQQHDSTAAVPRADSQPAPKPKPWYERFTLRGYTHLRYNDLFLDDDGYACQACDNAIGGVKEFSVRRSRLVFNAMPVDQLNFKMEIDLANAANNQTFNLQMREVFGDIYLDHGKNAWLRLGLAKVPYGYENLQSSSQRLPFDRADAVNSGAPGERDVGVFFTWGTSAAHRTLKAMADSAYKGEGDNGIVNVAVYNGQTGNRAEANDDKHVAVRLAYPFLLPRRQIVELAVQGYTGTYTLTPDMRTAGVTAPDGYDFDDRRVAVTFSLIPRPVGLLAEWNWGDGPRYDPARNAVVNGELSGGYVQAMYRLPLPEGRLLFPYARFQHYEGGKKNELDARYYDVDELEVGMEFLVLRAVELTAAYVHGDRRFEDGAKPDNAHSADFVRLQLQLNY